MSSAVVNHDLRQRILDRTGQDIRTCYQCGKCTAGCPMAPFMDLAPNQIMRLAQSAAPEGTDRLLASRAIWACAGCLTCTQRCPKELDLAAAMDVLRELAWHRGCEAGSAKRILAFHSAFLQTVRRTGRMSELGLVARYKLASGDLLSDVMLAPAMLAKGKLPLFSHKIRGKKEIRNIFNACRNGKEARP